MDLEKYLKASAVQNVVTTAILGTLRRDPVTLLLYDPVLDASLLQRL